MEEDIKVVELHLINGMKWCQIAKELPGRTDNSIKNRYNANLGKRLHEEPFLTICKIANPDQKVSNSCPYAQDLKSNTESTKDKVEDLSVS